MSREVAVDFALAMAIRQEPQADGNCDLQALLGIEEPCSRDCLYFERSGNPPVGCLYKGRISPAFPRSLARSLLKPAHRRFR